MIKKKEESWKVIWTNPAVENLSEIAEFIGRHSQYYATQVAKAIYEKVESLSIFPLRGRIVPEFNRDDYREVFYQSYRIIYKVESHRVAILSIIHSSRDLEVLIDKESLN